MNCRDVRKMLHAYLDGWLNEAEAPPVRAHLVGCADCRRTAQQIRTLSAALSQQPDVEPSADLSARVRGRLLEEGLLIQPPAPLAWLRSFLAEGLPLALGVAVALWGALRLAGAPPLADWTAVGASLSTGWHGFITALPTLPSAVASGARNLWAARPGWGLSFDFDSQLRFALWVALAAVTLANIWMQWRLRAQGQIVRGE